MSAPSAPAPRLRRNALANIVGRMGSVLIGVAITPIALDALGPERFGIWSLFFVLSGAVASLDLGMWASVSRFVAMAAARGESRGITITVRRGLALILAPGAVLALACAFGSGLFIALFHVPAPIVPEVRVALPIFAVSLVLLSTSLVLQGALTGLQRLDLWNLWFTLGLLSNAIVLVYGLHQGWGLVAAGLAATTGQVVTNALASLSLRTQLGRLGSGGSGEGVGWRELIGYGAVLQAANGLGMAQAQAGKVLLGLMGRLTAVAQFELGMRVANAVWSLPVLTQLSVLPAAAHASATEGVPGVRRVYEWCCRWVFASSAWALGALWLVAPPLFYAWLGPAQDDAIATARWLAGAYLLSTLGGPGNATGRGAGWPDVEVVHLGVALVINVLGGLVLLPRFGAPGAAAAMAISFAAASVCSLAVFHRRLEMPIGPWLRRLVLPRYLPAIVLVAALQPLLARVTWGSRWSALAVVIVAGLAYTALYAAATWRTGDPAAVLGYARAVLQRRRSALAPAPEATERR